MVAEEVPDDRGHVDPRSILAVVDADAPAEAMIGELRHLLTGEHADIVRYVGLFRE